ncbi:hypothetical protein RJ640_008765 [Escallonia rubra]|uniref:Membrane-bound O-acyltransferase C24H6.01c n=1 Tax=Escallonia rubra TaxID=112253 RepID=A0AA88Q9L9_9ASTE|nr:hypothetical protein RJ640_008765 [Escallonia rubra]
MNSSWRRRELALLILYAIIFYAIIIRHSLRLSRDHHYKLYGLRAGWIANRLNDASDAQWRNFRGNLPILTIVLGIFTLVANMLRAYFHLQAMGMSVVWLLISLTYLCYLHGAFILFVLAIASVNFLLAKVRVVQENLGLFGQLQGYLPMAYLLQFWYTICLFNFLRFMSVLLVYLSACCSVHDRLWMQLLNIAVVLRMISFGYDYHWADRSSRIDQKERSVQNDKFSFVIYLCYLVYAPLYIAGPVISFNAFASQLDTPQKNYSLREVAWYGLRWGFSLLLMELMTHFFYYNAFAISGLWKQLTPLDVFIIGYGVLNFMWLKFFLIWRYFRFWSLISGIETPENMPRCINNCHNLESFWKNWHASFNKWLVRYMYIPLGGSQTKLLNVWVVFTFVAIWHDLEWKLLSWAWLTCIFFIPELIVKSAANAFQVESTFGEFVFRELSAVAGAVTITCLMV